MQPSVEGAQALMYMMGEEMPKEPPQIGNLDVALRFLPVSVQPDHRGEFLDRIQRLLVRS